ncbi:50S ribosomal protein L1 [uncultured archaeon]|nr:50S ribosomal protein L1 [uncultured archaeon]
MALEDKYSEFEKFMEENRSKRKFEQSVELAINFRSVDFSKQVNRLNLDILLPNGKGKTSKIALFATDKALIEKAGGSDIEILDGNAIAAMANDKEKLAQLLNYVLVAQQNLMPTIARYLGPYLGPRNKMPKPFMPGQDLTKMSNDINKSISIRNKGKFLPTVHCVVGSEKMDSRKIYDNVKEVVSAVTKKTGVNHIRSVYVKLTMSKPFKLV